MLAVPPTDFVLFAPPFATSGPFTFRTPNFTAMEMSARSEAILRLAGARLRMPRSAGLFPKYRCSHEWMRVCICGFPALGKAWWTAVSSGDANFGSPSAPHRSLPGIRRQASYHVSSVIHCEPPEVARQSSSDYNLRTDSKSCVCSSRDST